MTDNSPQQDLSDNEANAADAAGAENTAAGTPATVETDDTGAQVSADATVQGFEPGVLPVSASSTPTAGGSLSALNDVQMVVTAELGRTTMPMRELLGLTPGVVVEIDRAAGSPIDLLVNGRRIASGEVVVIDEEFGIRITEIIASNASESRRVNTTATMFAATSEVGLGELFVRMIISLAVVLGIVLGAYWIIKRRRGGGSGSGAGRSLVARPGRVRTPSRNGLQVLGRTGVARGSSVVAIQFADRVLLIGGNDQAAPTMLAEIDLEGWELAMQPPVDPMAGGPGPSAGSAPSGLLDALRQATTRRG